MSQHISGSIGQTVAHEYGEFISVGDMRIRKALIQSYNVAKVDGDVYGREWGIRVVFGGGAIGAAIGTEDDAKAACEKLDWIFQRDYRNATADRS